MIIVKSVKHGVIDNLLDFSATVIGCRIRQLSEVEPANNGTDFLQQNFEDCLTFRGRRQVNKKDFVKTAEADGFKFAVRLDKKADMERVISEWLSFPGPAFLEVIIDRDAGVYPMVGPGLTYDQMITGDFIPSRVKTTEEDIDGSSMF